jgi:hypothetical protein
MKVHIVGRNMGHQNSHANALEQGLKSLGIQSQRHFQSFGVQASICACWGWRVGNTLRASGAEVLVMERGYVGDRFAWTSLGWNGLNGRATFPPAPEDGGARFREHHGHLLQPWREGGGEYVLLIGQVPGDASLRGRDMRPWYAECAKRAARRFRLPVVFRHHPLAPKRGGVFMVPGTSMNYGSLQDALARAAVVITFNSNTGVDSVLAGVPTVCIDRGSMAFEMCSHDIDAELVKPNRDRWAAQLAWRQWTIDEIRSGAALRVFSEFTRVAAA